MPSQGKVLPDAILMSSSGGFNVQFFCFVHFSFINASWSCLLIISYSTWTTSALRKRKITYCILCPQTAARNATLHLDVSQGHGSQVTGGFCHEECEARHLDPVEQTRWDPASGFQYPAKPLVVITVSWQLRRVQWLMKC